MLNHYVIHPKLKNIICQLYLNKTGRKPKKKKNSICFLRLVWGLNEAIYVKQLESAWHIGDIIEI